MHQQFADFSYPASLDMLKGSEIFTKEPINPYTGVSMLTATISTSSAGITYQKTATSYTLKVIQSDMDDVDNSDTTTTLYTAIPTMLPTAACQ